MNTTRMEMQTPDLDDRTIPGQLIDIQWGIVERDALPGDLRVSEWVKTCLDYLNLPDVEVCVRIVEVAEIQYLNEHYRGKDKPTNVLSFSGSTNELFAPRVENVPTTNTVVIRTPSSSPKAHVQSTEQMRDEYGRILLGDIIICSDVVLEEAEHQAKPIDAHFCHLLIHGLLHLQGYDHSVDDRAEEMEEIEKDLMKQFGYDDPYQ